MVSNRYFPPPVKHFVGYFSWDLYNKIPHLILPSFCFVPNSPWTAYITSQNVNCPQPQCNALRCRSCQFRQSPPLPIMGVPVPIFMARVYGNIQRRGKTVSWDGTHGAGSRVYVTFHHRGKPASLVGTRVRVQLQSYSATYQRRWDKLSGEYCGAKMPNLLNFVKSFKPKNPIHQRPWAQYTRNTSPSSHSMLRRRPLELLVIPK